MFSSALEGTRAQYARAAAVLSIFSAQALVSRLARALQQSRMLGGQGFDHRRTGASPLTKVSGRLETSSGLTGLETDSPTFSLTRR